MSAETSRRRGAPPSSNRRRPGLGDLGEDALAEHVSGSREREGDVRVQALQLLGRLRAADPESSDAPPSDPRSAPASSRRTRRCSSVARASDSASSSSSATARLQRSTPPAASIRAIAATRCGHVR